MRSGNDGVATIRTRGGVKFSFETCIILKLNFNLTNSNFHDWGTQCCWNSVHLASSTVKFSSGRGPMRSSWPFFSNWLKKVVIKKKNWRDLRSRVEGFLLFPECGTRSWGVFCRVNAVQKLNVWKTWKNPKLSHYRPRRRCVVLVEAIRRGFQRAPPAESPEQAPRSQLWVCNVKILDFFKFSTHWTHLLDKKHTATSFHTQVAKLEVIRRVLQWKELKIC